MTNLLLALIYMSFISLGLPDAVLGAAWPIISRELGTPISNMGIVTIIIAAGTIISSLQSARLINKIGVHKITAFSVLLTAISLLGFAYSPSFFILCLWAIPYGLGAGSVDAALNNYVAVNFASKHMSWLHCSWGLGASLGPYIMGMALTHGYTFRTGYEILFALQAVLTLALFLSSPIWRTKTMVENNKSKALTLKEVFKIKGVRQIALAFFCFCAIEHSTGLWASSYLVYNRGVAPELAASFAALFYFGIAVGRGICGFIAMRYDDTQMIKGGSLLMALGVLILLLPLGDVFAFSGLIMIGLGSAPVFPCVIHSTPHNFGLENSQAVTGVLMASAYTGILVMPALFGLIGKVNDFNLYPICIGLLLVLMFIMYEITLKKIAQS